MNTDTLFELVLFDPENTVVSLLEKRDIEFRKQPVTRQFVVATDETIEVIGTDNPEILIENLVSIFVEWLEGKQNRKLQAQLVDGSIVYIDKNDTDGVTYILKNALKVTAFDPEYNTRIGNK